MPPNQQILLDNRPQGKATGGNFKLVARATPALQDGEVLVRHHCLGLDPYMRGRMDDSKSYAAPQPLGEALKVACPDDYNGAPLPMAHPGLILVNRVRVQGFIVSEHMDVWPEALAEMGSLVSAGQLRPCESMAQGLAAAPQAFLGLLKGRNFGQQPVRLV